MVSKVWMRSASRRIRRGSPSPAAGTVPDILDEAGGVIGEVKNVRNLSYTAQLRDYIAYAQAKQLQSDLYVRGSTLLSGPLQEAVHGGFVNLWARLPS